MVKTLRKNNRFKRWVTKGTKHTIGIAKKVMDVTEKQLFESIDAHKGIWKNSKWN